MTADYDMEDLTTRDLDRAHESLYYAARRYCTITEQGFRQGDWDNEPGNEWFVSIGRAADELTESARRYAEADSRWAASIGPGPDDDPSDDQEDPA